MVLPNFSQLAEFPVAYNNASPPKEGNRAIPVNFDFTTATSYTFDFSQVIAQKKLSFVQTLYIDNSANAQPLTLVIQGTNQTIIAPPASQGYYAALITGIAKVTIGTTGNVVVPIEFLNFVVAPVVWGTTGSASVVNGKLQVQDTILEGTVNGTYQQNSNFITASGQTILPFWRGNQALTVATAASPTSIIPAQGVGIGWFISNITVDLTADATIATMGNFTISIQDNATTIFQVRPFVPAVVPTILNGSYLRLLSMNDISYNSKTANVALRLSTSAALVTGLVIVNVTWGNTTQIGP